MSKRRSNVTTLGSVHVGAKLIFRTEELLGERCRKPPFEGQVLTVVGFELRYRNNVVLQEANGKECLMPLDMVEKALQSRQLVM